LSHALKKIEFGDFQTPDNLASEICAKLVALGIAPDVVVEPTCGVGAFVRAAAAAFPAAQAIHGFEINPCYLAKGQVPADNIHLTQADFFATDWQKVLRGMSGSVLVLGNFPWVTNTAQSVIGGKNLPEKSNFQKQNGFDAISGKANFDISEWMLLEVLKWFSGRAGDIAMLVKTAVARKVLAHAERQKLAVREAKVFSIDAKKHFNAAVDACLLVIRLSEHPADAVYDYTIYPSLSATTGRKVGYRNGMTVGDLVAFELSAFLMGECPQKWRSGVKHDAAAMMELTRNAQGTLINGWGEPVDIEADYLFPLLKGSDIGSGKVWREKFVLITQHFVGETTDRIRHVAPKTWAYLQTHAATLQARGSSIYKKNPPFSIFGIGDYAFRPWRIAICSLYKTLNFRLVSPIENKPVMFDDTVYYLSFDTEQEAQSVLELFNSESATRLLSSLIFWDDKRPIKTSVLNVVDWARLGNPVLVEHAQSELWT
jgi:hypothetical protein